MASNGGDPSPAHTLARRKDERTIKSLFDTDEQLLRKTFSHFFAAASSSESKATEEKGEMGTETRTIYG